MIEPQTSPAPSSRVTSPRGPRSIRGRWRARRPAERPRAYGRRAGKLLALVLVLCGGATPKLHAQGGGFDDWERKPLVDWLTVGAVTSSSAAIKLHVRGDAREVRVAASLHPDLRDPVLSSATVADDETDDGLSTVLLTGLQPNSRYYLATLADGKIDTARRGRLRTFPDGPGSYRIVASGDVSPTGVENAVFPVIRDLDPMLFLTVGDILDRTLIVGSIEEARQHWRLLRRSETFGALVRDVPWAHMWDDHDYGVNDGDRTFKHRWASRLTYLETVPHYPLALPAGPGENAISQAFSIGRVRFVLTDLRSDRDPKTRQDGETKSMLGKEQRLWFEQELRSAAPAHALVVWVSSVPWTADPLEDADHWGGYHHERQALATLIRDIGVPVVSISGDAHTVAIDDGRHTGYASGGGGGIPAIQTGALAAVGKSKEHLGPFSHGRQPNRSDERGHSMGDGQFVTMDVTDFGGSRLCLQVQGWRVEGPTGRLMPLRQGGTGYTGPPLRWGRCWDAATVPGVREHRIALPFALDG